jgi:hypothetical protein
MDIRNWFYDAIGKLKAHPYYKEAGSKVAISFLNPQSNMQHKEMPLSV